MPFLHNVVVSILSALVAATLYGLAISLYRLYFSPLSKIPGSKIWAATDLTYVYYFSKRRAPMEISRMHQKYGRVIRTGPNTVSTIDPESWEIICGQKTTKRFQKANYGKMDQNTEARNLINANDADHARQRRLINHAFSDKALKDQEEIIKSYQDTLIAKLMALARAGRDGAEVNLTTWMEYVTFDIVADLAFGEPFGCLQDSGYHPWVKMFPRVIAIVAMLGALVPFKPVDILYLLSLSKKDKETFSNHAQVIDHKLRRRLEMGADRKDIMSYILRHSGEKGMSRHEIEQNASIFVLAGSETTATALTTTIYQLAKNPSVMSTLVQEIRAAFQNESEINMTSVQHLKYLQVVLTEGMRCFPSVPIGGTRSVPPEGTTIDGQYIPGGTIISIPQLAAYQHPDNFKDPLKYEPSRWLGNPAYAGDHLKVFQPFSHGTRDCVGKNLAWAEMKVILARMVWNFEFELLDDGFNISNQGCMVLWFKPAMNVRLRPRAV